MQITNKMKLPQAIVDACQTEEHNRQGNISATTLLNGVKNILLTTRHWDELTEDAADSIWKIFGTAAHIVLEKSGDSKNVEMKLRHEFLGRIITGRVDDYNPETATVEDYKTASIWKVKFNDFEGWKKQGLIYAWLFLMNDIGIKRARFTALLKDHSKSKAKFDPDYPKSPVFVYEVPITKENMEEIEKFIFDKVKDIIKYETVEDDLIPECTESERWAKGRKFAVMKPTAKKAVKLFDEKCDAENMAIDNPGFYVEERPGEDKKCEDYCAVNQLCNYYKNKKVGG